jgi:hypothetical protein
MRRFHANTLIGLALFFFACAIGVSTKQLYAQTTPDACISCHADFLSVLPKEHVEVKGTGLAACTACHAAGQIGEAKPNAFSTRLHLSHAGPKMHLDCTACHTFVPGKSFGLIGQSLSWGAPKADDMKAIQEIFISWTKSGYTDHLHAKAMVDCAGCHGKELPSLDTTIENSRCLACHGPMEKLASKSAPKDFPKRNPHDSHLGDIACTVCHHAHTPSKAYCLDCHKTFKMTIPGGEE